MIFRRRRPPPGSVPGALNIAPDSPRPRLHVFDYTQERYEECDIHSVSEIERFTDPGSVTWLDVQGLGDERLLHEIADFFGLHPLLLADVVNIGQRPKVEPYEGMLLIVTRMVSMENDRVRREQVSIVLGPDYVLTFQEQYGDILDPVRGRIRNGALVRRMKADYLAYAIFDTVVDGFYPVLDVLGERLDALEDEVVENPTRGTVEQIHHLRRELINLRRAIWPQRDAASALVRDSGDMISDAVRVYLRDTHDHAFQITDVVESYREIAAGLMEVYLSSVGQRTNEIMRVLTVLSSIFIPLTFIVGIYGMNFDNMPELRHPLGYFILLAVMFLMAVGMFGFFAWRGWIGTGRSRR